ncbi:MAG: fumarate reductase subunit D [Gemmatimonadetes bacterium]|nr:fumarate reductase subunit D [Gemmatimonadota bacterium]MYB97837.1 fumarate reductase subunit D [Gemmatimonadota bacterium]MYI45821.1 fumarate reductase subunit D [Gemmatimonadota bacterium]
MKRSDEAFWWALFSAGGVMAALFVPAFVLVTGFLLPAGGDGAVAAERTTQFAAAVGWWPVKLALLGVLALSFVHCGHRIRHTLMDLGLRRYSGLLKVPCYGGALAATVWAALLLWRV